MVSSLLAGTAFPPAIAGLLRPEPLPCGAAPEERVILCGVSWQRYRDLDKALGHDRPTPRFYYLKGALEIMTTSKEDERIQKLIAGLLEIYFDDAGIDVVPHGHATMRNEPEQVGAEPDESWCLGEEREFPDLAIEIAFTSGGVDKLEVYRRFNVSEVWFWRHDGLDIFALDKANSTYERLSNSRLLPRLNVALLERCVGIASWREARQTFRAGMADSF